MNTERKTNNPGSLVEKIATGKANALEIDHDDLLIGIFHSYIGPILWPI